MLGKAVLTVLGVLLLGWGGMEGRRSLAVKRGLSTEGTVVMQDRGHGERIRVVRFIPEGGAPSTLRPELDDEFRAYHVNDELKIVYDPADPSKARVDSFVELWLRALVAALAGGLMLLRVHRS